MLSALLVAAIAVLSLPTIQSLTPLTGYLEVQHGSIPASGNAATDYSIKEHAATAKGAAGAGIDGSAEDERIMEAGDGQAKSVQGGTRQ